MNPSEYYESAVAKNLPDAPIAGRRVDRCPLELPVTDAVSESELLREIDMIENRIRDQVSREIALFRQSNPIPTAKRTKPARKNVPSFGEATAVVTGRHQTGNPTSLPATRRVKPSNPALISASAATSTTTTTTTVVATRLPPTSSSPPPPSPSPPPPSPPLARVRSSISQGSALQIERLSRSGKGKDPPLTFHTLDFAGQKLYRPMHHCFITRRAMYIVVFNLQVLVKDLNEKVWTLML